MRALVLVLLAGCSAPPPVVAPPVVIAPQIPAPSTSAEPPAPSAGDGPAPLELAISWEALCARVGGRVHCGTLDDPRRPLVAEPPLGGIEDAVSVSAGHGFLCLATQRGTVHCQGDNQFGQLGARLRDERHDGLVQVANLNDARRVVAGPWHACAILASGGAACWGRNERGQTGSSVDYTVEARELVVPAPVPELTGVTSIAAAFSTTCATVAHDGWCWGEPPIGDHQRARGNHGDAPARLGELTGIADISAGESIFCGVGEGAIKCWGSFWSFLSRDHPSKGGVAEIAAPGTVRRVRVANHHGCALLRDGRVACFGASYGGALGIPGPESFDPEAPRVVPDLPRAVDVAVGGGMSCAITGKQEAYCWGAFPGKSGRKETTPRRIPITG